MSKLYLYYQKHGGNEDWQVVQAETSLDDIKPTFITVLKTDTILNRDSTRDMIERVKYIGPMYFDLDDADDVENSIEDAKLLLEKFKEHGLTPDDVEIYLSGKKGLHLLIPPEVFMVKPAPLAHLPLIYKEIAFKLAVDTTDFKVYSERKGRMLRTCYNQRDNGNYRVPVTWAELENLTPEQYDQLCKSPRQVPKTVPSYRAAFALIFDAAKQKVPTRRMKVKPIDPKMLRNHLPTLERLMRGEGVIEGAGFNKIALQLAIYAREAGIGEDALVEQCQGLIANHESDGYRYNTAEKRERELRRMTYYVEGNHSYVYDIAGINALLQKNKVAVTDEDGETSMEDVHACGVFQAGNCYMVPRGEAGDVAISNFVFTDVQRLIDPATGITTGLSARLQGDSTVEKIAEVVLYPTTFTGSSSLHNCVAPYGGSFTGSDLQARGLYQIMLKTVDETHYIVDSEGLHVLQLPLHHNPVLREPFLAWVDPYGVRVPDHIQETNTKFVFQGYPEPRGQYQTDLVNAPALGDWLNVGDNKRLMLKFLKNWLTCQQPDSIGRMTGWAVSCFYREMFHAAYGKFPLMHVYGPAGTGKSEMTSTLFRLFYDKEPVKSITPSSTAYAVINMIGGSASIPLLVDEYKVTGNASKDKMETFRAIFRDAYNRRDSYRGGGSRTKDNFNALNKVTLSAPIAFLAEAIEPETALVERYVLVTLRRFATNVVNVNKAKFQFVQDHSRLFGILGHALAAGIAKTGSIQTLSERFDKLLGWATDKHSLSAEFLAEFEKDPSDQVEYQRRNAGRPRVIFNNTVALFGLTRLRAMMVQMFGKETFEAEFADLFEQMTIGIYSNMETLSVNATAEYIKVLNTMAEMSYFQEGSPYRLVEGVHYNRTEIAGRSAVAIVPGYAYSIYRAFLRNSGQTPLFLGDSSFIQALRDCPQFICSVRSLVKTQSPAITMDEEELIRAGVSPFLGRSVNLPR